jgi:hypothetical protein
VPGVAHFWELDSDYAFHFSSFSAAQFLKEPNYIQWYRTNLTGEIILPVLFFLLFVFFSFADSNT